MLDFRYLSDFYKKLMDDESRFWFNLRIEFAINHDYFAFRDNVEKKIEEKNIQYTLGDVERIDAYEIGSRDIAIYGTGQYSKDAYHVLKNSKWKDKVKFFIDSNQIKRQNRFLDKPVVSPRYICEHKGEFFVIIGSVNYALDMYHQLIFGGFDSKHIFLPPYGKMVGFISNQYFDVFSPHDNEIFVDAGALNGNTSLDFTKWCKENYKYIYVFEPSKANAKTSEENLKNEGINFLSVVDKALLDKRGTVSFSNDEDGYTVTGAASVTNVVGGEIIETVSLDEFLCGNPVTFIKMDIEGSELQALIGAENTIKKYKPRFAICIYHKWSDIYEIPILLNKMLPEYRYYIRHYSSADWETVLYATI